MAGYNNGQFTHFKGFMSDYKDTLNLPYTDFPMRGNLPNNEPKILKKWQDDNLYQRLDKNLESLPSFILHDGPPYANGNIHIGHAVNKILKDIIIKSKRLNGFYAPFVPGWDCHGLPIELNVEKKKGKVGQKISAKDFRLACRLYADKQIIAQKQDFERLGILADWQEPYLTKNYQYEADIIRALGVIIDNGHLSQGVKPVHWCCDCASALAEAEVEYQDKQSPAIYVKFTFIDKAIFNLDKPVSIVIWTTTPWTLPANEAVAVHGDFNYQVVLKDGEYLLIASDCLVALNIENITKTQQIIKGYELETLKVKHPFYDKQVPIILGEHVSSEAGTGAVHTAPSHGQEDFTVGLKYQLPVDNLVNDKGVFFDEVPLVGGQFVFKANQIVIDELKTKNTLLYHHNLSHSYPHCWRHKTPVIFRATPQWFISMDNKALRAQALVEIKAVDWLPDWGQKRIALMLENRPDWCISRQRSWGVPIPLFVHKQSKALHPNTGKFIEEIAKKVEQSGIEAWFLLEAKTLLGNEADHYEKITDTLDVWFDSGVSHFAVLGRNQQSQKPADLYLEGSDQHRGWFQSSLLSSVAIDKTAPYKQVLTHGFTVDSEGKKMSKSLGNVISPQKVVGQLGADILRLWVASSDYVNEMTVSDEILKGTGDGYRRIRNTIRFMLANMSGFSPDKDLLPTEKILALDQWILLKAQQLNQSIQADYEQYQFHLVIKKIMRFCANELGGFYLDVIKDRQYTCQENSVARRSAQTTLYHLTHILVRLIAPILSFTAEEVWQYMPNKPKESVFLQSCYYQLDISNIKTNEQAFDYLRGTLIPAVKKSIEKMRANKEIGSSLETEIDLHLPQKNYNLVVYLQAELHFIFIVSKIRLYLSDTLTLKVCKSQHKKCVRCWHHNKTVGTEEQHPQLCERCVENIANSGEIRQFA